MTPTLVLIEDYNLESPLEDLPNINFGEIWHERETEWQIRDEQQPRTN